MSARAGATEKLQRKPRATLPSFVCALGALWLAGCSGGLERQPLVEFSTDVVVRGGEPHVVNRVLGPGTWLVEVRERDVDLRVGVDAGDARAELADAFLRHGQFRKVVSLREPATVRVTLASVDVRSWKGRAAVRILRWPKPAAGAPPDARLLGFEALGLAQEHVARGSAADWRAAADELREAARQFQAAGDVQALADAEYQRGFVELHLLFDFEAARRTAEAAIAHFRTAADEVGVQRAGVLLSLVEFNIASGMGPDVPRQHQRGMLDEAARRMARAQAFFESRGLETDALNALNVSRIRERVLGDFDTTTSVYESIRERARERGDQYYEVVAVLNLAYLANRRGDAVEAARGYESLLPLVEPDRKPDLYATVLSNLGYALTSLGAFDRAMVAQTEALELFSARGDQEQTARAMAALAAVQFRSGNVERALSTIESALPLYERGRDPVGHASALRLAGNAAAELGHHQKAIQYLRHAERRDTNGITTDRTRVLLAGELRIQGDLEGAERMLAGVLQSRDESTRADALAERARLRQQQLRQSEALADLRAADAIYARLKLDFDRIDSSSALALALLDAGDIAGAGAAADTAIAKETRIRVSSANPEMRARFLSASYAPYEARIEVDLATAPGDRNAVWRAFRTADTIRARSLTDRLAHGQGHSGPDAEIEALRETLTALQVDLERRTRRDQVAEGVLLGIRRRIDETQARLDARMLARGVQASSSLVIAESRASVQAALPEDTAVLAYFVGDRRSHAWLLTRKDLRHATLPGRRPLEKIVRDFIELQRRGKAGQSHPAFASLLGDLLGGVNAKRLLVLPDGPLNGLPFAALPLPRGQAREMLVDRFVVTAAPSLALALRPREPREDDDIRIAVISDPVYTPDDRRLTAALGHVSRFRGAEQDSGLLARLPYSAIEARAVTRIFDGAHIIELTGFDATARRVIELPARELDVLHFATHAVVKRDAPEQSALFLTEYAADGSPLPTDRLTADDITRSGLRADVVVLSGCATGDGRELRGEGVLGLTYGFLGNGSDAVVASLWPIEDALTARFMEEFYRAYRASGQADEALRAAQLRTRDAAGPAVWSSFVVRASSLR